MGAVQIISTLRVASLTSRTSIKPDSPWTLLREEKSGTNDLVVATQRDIRSSLYTFIMICVLRIPSARPNQDPFLPFP